MNPEKRPLENPHGFPTWLSHMARLPVLRSPQSIASWPKAATQLGRAFRFPGEVGKDVFFFLANMIINHGDYPEDED